MREIMMRAWEIVRTMTNGTIREKLSAALKQAWAEAKAEVKMTKETIVKLMNKVAAASTFEGDSYKYEVKANDWVKYGKNRTYFEITETRTGSKHSKSIKYGYWDNITNEYVGDLHSFDFNFAGARI